MKLGLWYINTKPRVLRLSTFAFLFIDFCAWLEYIAIYITFSMYTVQKPHLPTIQKHQHTHAVNIFAHI